MADNLDLLFRIRGDATGAKNATEQARQAVHQLRTSATSDLKQIQQSSTQSLGSVTQSLTQLGGQLPVVGGAVNSLSASLGSMTVASKGAAAGMAGLAGPIGLAVVGIGLTAAAVGTLGAELFNLAKSSADIQDKLDDLSQQTGVNVETLSALEILVKSSGGSIDNLAQSLVVFQGKLDDAQDSTSKTGEQFRKLGISTHDTETALRDALNVLAKMPEGFNQTNTAAELFGRRGARQFLGVLKEAHGDLDGAIRRLKELGLVISDADAKAASDFNKQLDLLNFQLRAVGVTIGREIIPVALAAIKDLSKALKDNKDAINDVATVAGLLSNLFTGPLKGSIILVEDQFEKIRPILETTAALYERIADAIRFIKGKTNFATAAAGVTGAGLGDLAEVGGVGSVNLPGQKTTDVQSGVKESADQLARDLELQRKHTEDLRFEHERRTLDLTEFFDKQDALITERYTALSNQITRERNLNQEAFNRGIADLQAYEDKKRDLDLQATRAENARDEAQRQLKLDRQRAAIREEVLNRERLSELDEVRRAGELRRLEIDLERGRTVESEVLTRRLDFLVATQETRIGIINYELKAEGVSAERKKELNQQKAVAEQQYTDEFKRLSRERVEALAAEAAAGHPGIAGEGKDIDFFSGIGKEIENQIGPPLKQFTELTPQVVAGIDSMRDAFGALGQAVGQALHAFVLFGSAGTSFRKFTAEVLAAVAAQAAVKAVFELAEGFAMLALTYFTGNPKYAASASGHFIAAATYGAIAGVAAIAGRAVAGDSFQRNDRSSGGGTGAGTGQLNPLTLNRNQPQQQRIILEVRSNDSHIVRVVGADYRSGGQLREIILEDGG
jgi:hypothetical protein